MADEDFEDNTCDECGVELNDETMRSCSTCEAVGCSACFVLQDDEQRVCPDCAGDYDHDEWGDDWDDDDDEYDPGDYDADDD